MIQKICIVFAKDFNNAKNDQKWTRKNDQKKIWSISKTSKIEVISKSTELKKLIQIKGENANTHKQAAVSPPPEVECADSRPLLWLGFGGLMIWRRMIWLARVGVANIFF